MHPGTQLHLSEATPVSTVKGTIFNIEKYAIHDGPGIRTLVFFKGCTLRCQWCHNPEGQAAEPELMRTPDRCIGCGACARACPVGLDATECRHCGACAAACPTGARVLVGRAATPAEVLREIERDTVFYDESGGGVTISGGEPLMQPEFLRELLRACRQREIHTAIETSGFGRPADVASVAELVDLWLYDLKVFDERRHEALTGASNRIILDNLRFLAGRGAAVTVRIPLVPGVNDDDANLAATGAFMASLRTLREVHLLPYHSLGSDKYRRLGRAYPLTDAPEPTEEQMSRAAARLSEYGLTVRIGG